MQLTVPIDQPAKKLALFGTADRNLRLLRSNLGVKVVARDDTIRLDGDSAKVEKAAAVIKNLQHTLRRKDHLSAEDVGNAVLEAADAEQARSGDAVEVFAKGRRVFAKTPGQKAYLDAIFSHDLTFCSGPAGTGKTYLAVAAAVSMLKRGQIKKLVLARPAVEAGERLGFLPGDLQAKVNPYLRPLFDALNDMMDFEQVKRFMVNDVIEVVPLAFMRGRTLNDAACIMDEAQNTTESQMLMFLTRLGHNSKMIVTGDVRQNDLDARTRSGLVDAIHRLEGVEGVATVQLLRGDVVRHRLVQNIITAYGHEDMP
ncbi:MAG: PhoH family protein [Planctomycetota bacterium]